MERDLIFFLRISWLKRRSSISFRILFISSKKKINVHLDTLSLAKLVKYSNINKYPLLRIRKIHLKGYFMRKAGLTYLTLARHVKGKRGRVNQRIIYIWLKKYRKWTNIGKKCKGQEIVENGDRQRPELTLYIEDEFWSFFFFF